jgi:hypothetical protein
MSTITFDTLKYVKLLEASGVPSAQAEAFVNAQRDIFSEALVTSLATHADVDRMERKLIEHDGKFSLLQWMVGFNLAFTMAMLWKIFS